MLNETKSLLFNVIRVFAGFFTLMAARIAVEERGNYFVQDNLSEVYEILGIFSS